MPLLLCHDCFAWVEPHDGRCPDCLHTVDPAVPDPALPALAATIGDALEPLGEVRVLRKLLPEFGTLYATRGGLFFLPHRSEHVTQLVEDAGGSSLLWTLASVLWSPLIFVLPFVKTRQLKESRRSILRPHALARTDGMRLAELLMENPGVFFIPRRAVRQVARRRRKWVIQRQNARAVKLYLADDRRRFDERMGELFGRV